MKPEIIKTIVAGTISTLLLILAFTLGARITKKDLDTSEEIRIADSLRLEANAALAAAGYLEERVAQVRDSFARIIEGYDTTTLKEKEYIFIENFGPIDEREPLILIDSSSLDSANRIKIRLDECRETLTIQTKVSDTLRVAAFNHRAEADQIRAAHNKCQEENQDLQEDNAKLERKANRRGLIAIITTAIATITQLAK